MGKLGRKNVVGNRQWSASFRRALLETVRCGGRESAAVKSEPEPEPKPTLRSELERSSTLRSDKLSDLLREGEDVERKVEALEELQRVVKNLGDEDRVLEAATEVRRLTKDNAEARTTLGLLGAIPPLVALLDAPPPNPFQVPALYALLNLGIGNDANRIAIVKAGAVHKMLMLGNEGQVGAAIVANLLALTALDANKGVIGSSGAIPFLMATLGSPPPSSSSKEGEEEDALRALYNLSISASNIGPLLDAGVVPSLLSRLGDMEVSERILSILGNVVVIPEGRRAISSAPDAFPSLVDALNWTDSPGCQEKASYILMVMAHKAYGDRQAMIEAGVTSSLLELTLLGTTLAQKRASRILECFTTDKGKQVSGALSAPMLSQSQPQEEEEEEGGYYLVSQESRAVKLLVQQSLHNNMSRIARRANLPHGFDPSHHFNSLALPPSTSKSLPF